MKNSSPAFLFYSSDFLNGVSDLTMEERGQYITMMCLQHQKGTLSEKTIRLCLGSVSIDVLSKFQQDENGCYYNERLKEEIEKRTQFVDSRKFNGMKGGRPKNHMDNGRFEKSKPTENLLEDEKEDEDILVNKRKDNINYTDILNYWNENCKSYSSVTKLTEKRKEAIRKMIKNNHTNLEEIKKAMDIIECADPFWKGNSESGWKITFDWFINDTNGCFAKILEGQMTKNGGTNKNARMDSDKNKYR